MSGRVLATAGLFALSLSASLMAAEALVRHRELTRSTVPGTKPMMYYRHARLSHALVRDYSYFGWHQTDSMGFRRTGRPKAIVLQSPKILVLGESTTFDTEVSPDSAAWPSRMESFLGDDVAGFRGHVLNGGVSGYTVVSNVIRLLTDLVDVHPEIVIVYHGHNDLAAYLFGMDSRRGVASGDQHRPNEVPGVAPWTRWLENHSLLYGKVKLRVEVMRFQTRRRGVSTVSRSSWEAVVTQGADKFEQDLEILVGLLLARRISVVLATLTHVSAGGAVDRYQVDSISWATTLPGVPYSTIADGYSQFNERIRLVARRHGLPLVESASAGVVGRGLYAPSDAIHFNNQGAAAFGRFMSEELIRAVPHLLHAP